MKTIPFALLLFSLVLGDGEKNGAPPSDFAFERVQSVYKTLEIKKSGIYEKDGIVYAAFLCDICGRGDLELDSIALSNVYNMLREKFGIRPPFKIRCKNVANVKSSLTEKLLYVNAYPLKDIKDVKAAQDLRDEREAKAAETSKESSKETAQTEPKKSVNLAYEKPSKREGETPAHKDLSGRQSAQITAPEPGKDTADNKTVAKETALPRTSVNLAYGNSAEHKRSVPAGEISASQGDLHRQADQAAILMGDQEPLQSAAPEQTAANRPADKPLAAESNKKPDSENSERAKSSAKQPQKQVIRVKALMR